MTQELKLQQLEAALGSTLPKQMLDRLQGGTQDRVFVVETAHGILLTPFDPETLEALEIAAQAAVRYRDALRELAG